jgi:hypothetical protein
MKMNEQLTTRRQTVDAKTAPPLRLITVGKKQKNRKLLCILAMILLLLELTG